MLKLIRVQNTLTGEPVVTYRKSCNGVDTHRNHIYADEGSGIDPGADLNPPLYYVLEEKGANEYKPLLKCMKVDVGMEFETICKRSEVATLDVGTRVDLRGDDTHEIHAIKSELGYFVITDMLSAKRDLVIRIAVYENAYE